MSKNKAVFATPEHPNSDIQLSNPFAESFEQYIVYNAMAWQTRALVEIEPTLDPREFQIIEASFNASRPSMAYADKAFHDRVEKFASERYFVQQGSGKGQHLILCGAGPSLTEHAEEWCKQGDQIWGCNSAVTWLHDNGHKPTHAFTVDQTPHMYLEWEKAPRDIEYLVATTIHPHLADLLINEGRRFRYFNNFVGVKKPPVQWADASGNQQVMHYEEWLYALLFPGTVQSGSGLNTVTRALDVATYMGFDKITVLGADCSIRANGEPRKSWAVGSPPYLKWLKKNTVMHADGGHALASEATAMVMTATIDGRFWLSKPDLVISAQWLMRMARASEGKIELIGDTLPNAIAGKDEAWLSRLTNLRNADGKVMPIPF